MADELRPERVQLATHLGNVDALEFGAREAPLIIAIQGRSANLDVITEWEPAARMLADAGYRVLLPNLHSNEATKPGVVGSSDLQQIIIAIYQRCGASSAVIMGKSWGGGKAVEFVAAHPSMVGALVLVAPALSDLTLLESLTTVPTTLFWARDDTVKEFALSSHYTRAVPGLQLHTAEEGGHRVLPEYLPTLRAALARNLPG